MIPFSFLHLWLLTLPIDNSLNYSSDTHPTRASYVSRFLSGPHFLQVFCLPSSVEISLPCRQTFTKSSYGLLRACSLDSQKGYFFAKYRYCYPLSVILHWSRHTTAHILNCIIKMWAVIWSLHCPNN